MRIVIATGCILEPLRATHAHAMFSVLSDPAIYEFESNAIEFAKCITIIT